MNNVVLVGFMGSGKTTVGRALAHRTGRPFIDLDDEIAADAGRSIADIFADEGEAGFRERESRGLEHALRQDDAIIAAGGGTPLRDENWREMRSGNCVVALTAEPAELARRLNGPKGRPLLQPDIPSAIAALLPTRMARYLEADLAFSTDGKPAAEISRHIDARLPRGGLHRISIDVPGAAHEVTVGFHLANLAAQALRRLAASRPIMVVSDSHAAGRHIDPLIEALMSAGISAAVHLVPAGEAAKELRTLSAIYGALAEDGIDREGVLVSLGGGSVGDVAGFAAATWMRGIRYVQMPTTLLAMVDSSIGGKTAINLPAGKNLAGAVHQPVAIFSDLEYLETLADAEFRSALAEITKVALVADRSFVDWLSVNLVALLERDKPAMLEAVRRAVAIKAGVVSRDPHETGERAILNYGHTVGHALERAAGFGRLRHGEAVAWGMEVAGRLSLSSGAGTPEAVRTQHALLQRAGLLANRPEVKRADLWQALRHDKKSQAGALRFVLLREIGRADYGCEVDPNLVWDTLAKVLSL